MTWEERYQNLWSKYYNLSIKDCNILEEEISEIDEQIRRLQIRRAKLVARKHQESKNRLAEENERKKKHPILYLPFNKNRG